MLSPNTMTKLDQTFQTIGIDMPEINTKHVTSQGAFTLGSRLSPGSMATVQKWAPGRGAGTAFQAAANSKLWLLNNSCCSSVVPDTSPLLTDVDRCHQRCWSTRSMLTCSGLLMHTHVHAGVCTHRCLPPVHTITA